MVFKVMPEIVDLMKYPQKVDINLVNENNQLTIGDLHGNALRLINFLIRHRVIEMEKENYMLFRNIYIKRSDDLQLIDITNFKTILKNSRVNLNAAKTIRLIGDELCDRGKNDYFTLKVLEKLGKSGMSTEILFSNHGSGFLNAYTQKIKRKLSNLKFQWWEESGFSPEFDNSLRKMGKLIKKGLVDEKEIEQIVENHYKPNIKAISYTVDKTGSPPSITLFTHAPVGFETIREMATLYGVTYRANNIDAFCKTIDAINNKFSHELMANKLSSHLNYRKDLGKGEVPISFPLVRLIWNRCMNFFDHDVVPEISQRAINNIELPMTFDDPVEAFDLKLAHGHVGPSLDALCTSTVDEVYESYKPNMINLDSDLGKDFDVDPDTNKIIMEGTDLVLLSDHASAKDLNPITACYRAQGEKIGDILINKLLPYFKRLSDKNNNTNNFWCYFTENNTSVRVQAIKKLSMSLPGFSKIIHPTGFKNKDRNFSATELSVLREGKLGKMLEELEEMNGVPEEFTQAENELRVENARRAKEFMHYRAGK